MISGSSVLLDLPRSQRNGAPRRLRCRRACGSTRGLCSSAGVRTPDSGHTDSLVRLDNNRSPLSRWDDLFYFAERVSNKISSSGQRRGRRRSAVNHFRVKALGRTQPPGPKPLVGHLRTPILGVFCFSWCWRALAKLHSVGGLMFKIHSFMIHHTETALCHFTSQHVTTQRPLAWSGPVNGLSGAHRSG